MKQYLLLLKSSDFTKADNLWTSSAINLYNNSFYKNYSYTRSRHGLNLIGDNVYTGIEMASPSHFGEHATPISENAVYVTDAGEIVYEAATPDLYRFIDTSSRVDILAYKHSFTNISGEQTPTFNIQIYESDSENGPWLKSQLSFDSNVVFITDAKPWIKIELEVFSETNTDDLGLLFYLEIGIHEITSPVISTGVKNILRRFPIWTSIFEDSEEDATPSLATPNSVGGRMMTSLLQESIDEFVTQIDLFDLNSYVTSANENMLAWAYVSYNAPVNVLSIFGDSIQLANVHSLEDFYRLKPQDHAYFYNPIDKQIITIQKYETLTINGSLFEQYPINIFNEFDEFGARLGLPRLYLESNERYRQRILDVTKNLPGVTKEALKRTLRRELDIWKVYGATPDSDYMGATPEIIEMSDIENATPYFTDSGIPLKAFKDLVIDLNQRYPSNVGFVRWNEGMWDYAGVNNEGISRISAIYDSGSSPVGQYYQPGVGDFSDARLITESVESATTSFSGYAEIAGVYTTSDSYVYSPILLDYEWNIGYSKTVPDPMAGRYAGSSPDQVGVGITYEISTTPHGNYESANTFYANLSYSDREDFYVGNKYFENSPASPEHNYITIFDQEGYTLDSIVFRDKLSGDEYFSDSSANYNSIGINDITEVKIVFSNGGWNYVSQSYDVSLPTANYRIGFDLNQSNYYVDPPALGIASIASPNIDPRNANVKIGSNVYATKQENYISNSMYSSVLINEYNDPSTQSLTYPIIYTSDLVDKIIYPVDATPNYLYINSTQPRGISFYDTEEIVENTLGGTIVDLNDDTQYLVPSSPNILYTTYDSSDNQIDSADYFDSATINFSSTPSYIKLESAVSDYYPIYVEDFIPFTYSTTPNLFSGFIDSLENVYETSEQYLTSYFNSDDFLKTIYISPESFALDENNTYHIKDVNFLSDSNYIEVFTDNKQSIIDSLNSSLTTSEDVAVDLHAKRDLFKLRQDRRALHSGWLYLDEEDYYIYSSPVTDSATGSFFSLQLSALPTNGSPVIVDIDGYEYRNIIFEDSSTPGEISFYNTEEVLGNFGNSLYLAYENVSELSVTDKYTGQQLFSDLSTSSNKIECFDPATPSILNREYEVTYKLNDAWFIDSNIYDELNDEYYAQIYFSTTPNSSTYYNITYETSVDDNTHTIDFNIDSSVNPIDEGYVFISNADYDFSYIETYLSPGYISDNTSDLMYLSIISYDENDNFKPNQTFEISGSTIQATPNYVTTNDNGYAKTIIRYSGAKPATLDSSTISITGIGSATPNGNINSQTQGFYEEIDFTIRRSERGLLSAKAMPTELNLNADGVSNISIAGKILWNGKPYLHQADIAWNKARTLKDLFAATPDFIVTSDSNGEFYIENVLTAQTSATPGYWFARVNIIDEATAKNNLQVDGEVSSANEVTISGDVIYWHESYDPINYDNENDIPLPNIFTTNKQQNSDLIATPNFVYDHSEARIVFNLQATPNWTVPKWVPLNRYQQYQMGIMGSTPNYIEDYDQLHPDHEEQ